MIRTHSSATNTTSTGDETSNLKVRCSATRAAGNATVMMRPRGGRELLERIDAAIAASMLHRSHSGDVQRAERGRVSGYSPLKTVTPHLNPLPTGEGARRIRGCRFNLHGQIHTRKIWL